MKKIIIALLFCISSLSALGSGSDTVFRKLQNYYLTTDLGEVDSNPCISESLENLDRPVYVVKVSSYLYLEIATYIFAGYQVTSQLDDGTILEFYWDWSLEAIIADGYDGSLFILSP